MPFSNYSVNFALHISLKLRLLWDFELGPTALVYTEFAEFNKNEAVSEQEMTITEDNTQNIIVPEIEERSPPFLGIRTTAKEPGAYNAAPTHMVQIVDVNFDDYVVPVRLDSDIFATLMNDTFIEPKLRNFAYYDAKIRVTVVVNGAPQVAGRYLLAARPDVRYPRQLSNSSFQFNSVNRTMAYILPHLEIDPSRTATYTMDLPCPTPTGYYIDTAASWGTTMNSYSIWWVPIVDVFSGTDTLPTVSAAIYVSFVHIEGNAFTMLSGPAIEESSPKVSQTVNTISSTVAQAGNIPYIGKYATVFSGIGKAIASALELFGFSKPLDQTMTNFLITRNHPNLSHYNQSLKSYVLGSDGNNTVAIGNITDLGSMDDMSIPNLCNRYGLGEIVTIPYTTPSGTMFHHLDVFPHMSSYTTPLVYVLKEMTPMAHMCSFFKYWHGTLEYEIEVVASPFHRFNMLVAYEPDATAGPVYDRAVSVLHNTFVTVSGNTKFTFTIPWRRPFPWLEITRPGLAFGQVIDGMVNGQLQFYAINSISSNGSLADLKMIIKLKSPDIKLAYPNLNAWNHTGLQALVAPQAPVGMMSVMDNAINSIEPKEEIISVENPMATATPSEVTMTSATVPYEAEIYDNLYLQSFGENICTSVKALASKMSIRLRYSVDNMVARSYTTDRLVLGTSALGSGSFQFNATIFASPQGTGTLDYEDAFHWTFRDALSLAYHGMRGSTNVSIAVDPQQSNSSNANPVQVASLTDHPTNRYYDRSPLVATWENGYAFNNIEQQDRQITFNVPHNTPYAFKLASRIINFSTANVEGYLVSAPGSERLPVNEFIGMGDDGSFQWYLGCPQIAFGVIENGTAG